jgi:hypothetical protein
VLSRRSDIKRCQARGHGWPYVSQDDFSIAQNLLCQLNSVYEVSLLWQKHHKVTPYHAVMYARPDVVFNCPFPTQFIDRLEVCASAYATSHAPQACAFSWLDLHPCLVSLMSICVQRAA